MTFQELLFNLLGTYTSRRLKVIAKDWEGELLIKKDKVLRAEVFSGNQNLSGIEAINYIFSNQQEIERVEFLPFEDLKPNLQLGQMDLFSMVHPKSGVAGEENEPEEEIFSGSLLETCKKYFRKENIKLVYSNGKLEFASVKEKDGLLQLIEEYIQQIEKDAPCDVKKVTIRFSKAFCLILLSDENVGVVVADIEEFPNYELDQPFIDKELTDSFGTNSR